MSFPQDVVGITLFQEHGSTRSFSKRDRALMVVAHPDDEFIWGSDLLDDCGFEWHVVCCSTPGGMTIDGRPIAPSVRTHEFQESMQQHSIRSYEQWDFIDGKDMEWDERELRSRVLQTIKTKGPFCKVVTHNAAGEYGHPNHKACHRALRGVATHEFSINDIEASMKFAPRKQQLYESLYPSQYRAKSKYLRLAQHANCCSIPGGWSRSMIVWKCLGNVARASVRLGITRRTIPPKAITSPVNLSATRMNRGLWDSQMTLHAISSTFMCFNVQMPHAHAAQRQAIA